MSPSRIYEAPRHVITLSFYWLTQKRNEILTYSRFYIFRKYGLLRIKIIYTYNVVYLIATAMSVQYCYPQPFGSDRVVGARVWSLYIALRLHPLYTYIVHNTYIRELLSSGPEIFFSCVYNLLG